ncbi:MAG TPA: class II aldolase/adducin family protein [Syntrophales bacterium]|nr:class II aldolase/adducin family protein [Syntrophobacterales bacterium]HNQ01313.1 class II aldolase/adducin family protein [Syntrophales bacterium]HQL89400.1 class II aldolase/adducin family protein [Syntrophales bacterium]
MERPAREVHVGVKFRVEFVSRAVPADARLEELKAWCAEFHRRNFAPPYGEFSQGNLSFRIRPGEDAFIITGSQVGWKDRLADDRFVTVHGCDMERGIVYAGGARDPSSESMLHFAVYRARRDVQAVFHGHSREILRCAPADIPETLETQPYGSLELARGVIDVLGNADFVILKRHGFISLGRSMEEAGKRAIETHRLCLQGG